MVYDITSPDTFEKAKYWIGELKKNASGSIGEQRARVKSSSSTRPSHPAANQAACVAVAAAVTVSGTAAAVRVCIRQQHKSRGSGLAALQNAGGNTVVVGPVWVCRRRQHVQQPSSSSQSRLQRKRGIIQLKVACKCEGRGMSCRGRGADQISRSSTRANEPWGRVLSMVSGQIPRLSKHNITAQPLWMGYVPGVAWWLQLPYIHSPGADMYVFGTCLYWFTYWHCTQWECDSAAI